MSSNKFIGILNGIQTLFTAIAASAGVGDASKIIMTDATGKIDSTLMPSGIGAATKSVLASEALVAGDFVNIYNNAGTLNVRKADNSNGRAANGFVLSAFSSAANATVYLQGENTGRTGLTPGTIYFLATAGGVTTTAPTASGTIIQQLGYSTGTTSINFEYNDAISIA
ncbi:capsid fiber protein [Nostoc phage YongM]|nr:capsid fiber protein [Nostoc phage YongM]